MNLHNENDEVQSLMTIRHQNFDAFGSERAKKGTQDRPNVIPLFISNQRSMFETSKPARYVCFCFLCCINKKKWSTNINNKHIGAYYLLKNLACQSYDENSAKHEESLKILYISCLKGSITDNLISNEWKDIGFQSENPRTDFRGSGYISLLFITYFIKQYEEDFREILKFEYFLFAIVAIRLIFFFKVILNLFEDSDSSYLLKIHKLKFVSIHQFNNFLKKQYYDQDYYNEILSKCMVEIKNEYKLQYREEKKESNFLIIEKIIHSSFVKFIYYQLDSDE